MIKFNQAIDGINSFLVKYFNWGARSGRYVYPVIVAFFSAAMLFNFIPDLFHNRTIGAIIWLILTPQCFVFSILGGYRKDSSKVAAIVFSYVWMILFFAALYFITFKVGVHHFLFHDGIREGQVVSQFDQRRDEISALNWTLYGITALKSADMENFSNSGKVYWDGGFAEIEATNEMQGFDSLSIAETLRIGVQNREIVIYQKSSDTELVMGNITLPLLKTKGNRLSRIKSYFGNIHTQTEVLNALDGLSSDITRERNDRLNQYRDLVAGNPEWSIFDFIYVSAVTQTTLGFGDIVPNSTWARLLITIQCLMGVLLIAFSVDLLRKPRGDKNAGRHPNRRKLPG